MTARPTARTRRNDRSDLPDAARIDAEARRILRRLCETGAFLVLSDKLPKAVVMRGVDAQEAVRTAVLDRVVAEAFALRDWIRPFVKGRLMRYEITEAGRAALKRLLAEREQALSRQQGFAEQHREWGSRELVDEDETGRPVRRRVRANLGENPVTMLARKKDANGKPFLTLGQVRAAERLREDFELAQMGPRVTQNWERFLTAGREPGRFGDNRLGEGPAAARERVAAAVRDLGPGLADIVLRCCCFLEGLEAAEKRLGWSARSGKIVLRIGLQRLERHYAERYGDGINLMG